MLDYKTMTVSAAKRRDSLRAQIASTKADLVAMEKEIRTLDLLLKALPPRRMAAPRRARGKAAKKAPGKWKPGHAGRPPKWYVEQQAAKNKGNGKKKAAPKRKAKRTASPKVLAALARAREVRAANRAAAATAAESTG